MSCKQQSLHNHKNPSIKMVVNSSIGIPTFFVGKSNWKLLLRLHSPHFISISSYSNVVSHLFSSVDDSFWSIIIIRFHTIYDGASAIVYRMLLWKHYSIGKHSQTEDGLMYNMTSVQCVYSSCDKWSVNWKLCTLFGFVVFICISFIMN